MAYPRDTSEHIKRLGRIQSERRRKERDKKTHTFWCWVSGFIVAAEITIPVWWVGVYG